MEAVGGVRTRTPVYVMSHFKWVFKIKCKVEGARRKVWRMERSAGGSLDFTCVLAFLGPGLPRSLNHSVVCAHLGLQLAAQCTPTHLLCPAVRPCQAPYCVLYIC